MDSLTPDQAQALWDAGGFLVITDLPQGSEFGIDGTVHVVRRFSGIKFIPPGLHLITWSPPTSPTSAAFDTNSDSNVNAGPSTIPIRHALLREFRPRERVVLTYDTKSESVPLIDHADPEGGTAMISDDHLRTLDKEMAPYPFEGLEQWKSQTNEITSEIIRSVLGEDGRVDGLMSVEGEEEDGELKGIKSDLEKMELSSSAVAVAGGQRTRSMRFPNFDLKRSWRDGAVGEEVTRYSRDKSWLLGNLIKELDNDPIKIIAHLQLAFVLLLQLSSYSALLVYKRFLTLLCQSPSFLSTPPDYLPSSSDKNIKTIRRLYLSLLHTLSAELEALPANSFEGELPEMDLFYLDQIESLRKNLAGAMWQSSSSGSAGAGAGAGGETGWKEGDREVLKSNWNRLRDVGWKKWNWDIDEITHIVEDDEEEEEEGEYAPVVVEM
ncbi:hypothetical protein CI109_101623 [Kwoniella shandongensis]|uniref:Uncharacterized protein n=1 Tax=Kwoniella shandongensis TaxID=1734106 RepID=A0A5M6CBI6_9TREE|nr:uncharacterized protein CI109_001252 [Kwoniella shandongensis]KAA5530449.1 hypothetical protein CI109_001252 [Kwoniella shandongensis]